MNKEEAINILIKDCYAPAISDGYHTFQELYDHRHALYISLCKITQSAGNHVVWRSLKHSDGTQYKDWFILGIGLLAGTQVTYHLPYSMWEETLFADTLDYAPLFDGHTSQDVLERIKKL
jgi:hypothetical protein